MKKLLCGMFIFAISFFVFTLSHAEDNKAAWLSDKLYGSDNQYAKLKQVKLYSKGQGYKVHIPNQFAFICDLTFDSSGNPSKLGNCKTTAVALYSSANVNDIQWRVKEDEVVLHCKLLKAEQICTGKYQLCPGDLSCQDAVMKIARKLKAQ